MNLYYFANQIYQYSYALPIYHSMGGHFILKSLKRFFQFKRHLKDTNFDPGIRTWQNTPPTRFVAVSRVHRLKGVVISMSTAPIHGQPQNCRTIFVGHGTGDKKYGPNAELLKSYDYHFLSGPKHLEKLRDVGMNIPDHKLIKIGNPRFDDYINGKIDRERELDRLGIVDRTRRNILYAPTWQWGNGTLQRYVYHFARTLTLEYNLIIRPHHHDRAHIPKIAKWASQNRIHHIYFSNPIALGAADTMNDFRVSDLMISDTSSILYEYLITNQPIIVAVNDFDDLHHMPDGMNIMNYARIYDGTQEIDRLVEASLADKTFHDRYRKLLDNCFYFNDGKSVERAVNFIRSIS